jgi:ketosteroid isomerase-like protein
MITGSFAMNRILSLVVALALAPATALADEDAIAAALDAFHAAASRADQQAYFDLMTENVVFLGTDASERWQGQAFRDFVRQYFPKGRGWTYVPTDRHIDLAPDGSWALFDELLDNEKLGQCRGSGVLLRTEGGWKIAQYNLSVPVPNAIVLDVAGQIRSMGEQSTP